MATYAIGDVHGCFEELQFLLEQMPIDYEVDDLWMVGDLVNRGPNSVAVLRWARSMQERMGERFQAVLGNHDTHLLALAGGLLEPRSTDTAVDVIHSGDSERLLRWLGSRPLLYRKDDWVLVHAGIFPGWTVERAARWAERVAASLSTKEGRRILLERKADVESLSYGELELRKALQRLTRLRMVTPADLMVEYAGPPHLAPEAYVSWFDAPDRQDAGITVVCGHWAALGLVMRDDVISLDTGCVWGGSLTGVRLEDREVFRQPAV